MDRLHADFDLPSVIGRSLCRTIALLFAAGRFSGGGSPVRGRVLYAGGIFRRLHCHPRQRERVYLLCRSRFRIGRAEIHRDSLSRIRLSNFRFAGDRILSSGDDRHFSSGPARATCAHESSRTPSYQAAPREKGDKGERNLSSAVSGKKRGRRIVRSRFLRMQRGWKNGRRPFALCFLCTSLSRVVAGRSKASYFT